MKLPTEKLCRKLEELGFSYYEETKKSRCYRDKRPLYVYVPKHNQMPESAVRSILWQAGTPADEIEKFVRACKA